ncbi:uncharacterized protein ACNS7B_013239 [Menidia menidia]
MNILVAVLLTALTVYSVAGFHGFGHHKPSDDDSDHQHPHHHHQHPHHHHHHQHPHHQHPHHHHQHPHHHHQHPHHHHQHPHHHHQHPHHQHPHHHHDHHHDQHPHHDHHHDHDDDEHDSKQKLVDLLFWNYVKKETNSDECHKMFGTCHLKHKFNALVEKSTAAINKVLHFLYTHVTSVVSDFLHKLHYEIDHLKEHLEHFLHTLGHRLEAKQEMLEEHIHHWVEDLKGAAEHHAKALNIKGLKNAIRHKLKELKDILKQEPCSHDPHVKDVDDHVDYCESHLLHLTHDLEKKVSHKAQGIMKKHHGQKHWKGKQPSSCQDVEKNVENLWGSFCKRVY